MCARGDGPPRRADRIVVGVALERGQGGLRALLHEEVIEPLRRSRRPSLRRLFVTALRARRHGFGGCGSRREQPRQH